MTGVTRRPLAAALVVGLLLAPRSLAACSPAVWWGDAFATAGRVPFIAVATPDTMRAGPGHRWHRGWLDFDDRPVHGQVMWVDRLVSSADPSLAAAVRRAGGRVVVVPRFMSCRSGSWQESARWLDVGMRGLFVARLREPEHWAGGVPTFDLDPAGRRWHGVPYVGAPGFGLRRDGVDDWLRPDELLDVLAVRPTLDELERDPDAAVAGLRHWEAAHPTLAAREPARGVLHVAERMRRDEHAKRRSVSMAGTWRVTVVLPAAPRGDPARTTDTTAFYVRTARRPRSHAGDSSSASGVYVQACAAPTERRLVGMRAWFNCRSPFANGGEGYVAVGDSVWAGADGRRHRAGSFDIVAGDEALLVRRNRLSMAWIDAARTDPRRFLPGTFTEWPDGRVTFDHVWDLPGPRVWRVTAVRVSTRVM